MGRAKAVVKKSAHGSKRFNFMVFPDNDRWLWFVTFASTIPTDVPYWGRLLGCGDAPDEQAAWKQAKGLARRYRTAGETKPAKLAAKATMVGVG